MYSSSEFIIAQLLLELPIAIVIGCSAMVFPFAIIELGWLSFGYVILLSALLFWCYVSHVQLFALIPDVPLGALLECACWVLFLCK